MHVYAKMYIDDKVFDILSLKFGFDQKIRTNGAVCALPQGGLFDIKLDAGSDTLFYRWAASMNLRKEVKIVFYPVTEDRNSRVIELYDAQCIKYDCDFCATDLEPLVTSIRLSPGIIVQNGQVMVEKWWRLTDLSLRNAPNEVPVAPVYQEIYVVDENNRRLDEIDKEQKIELVVKTEGKVGKVISFDLNNSDFDFMYLGQRLKDDMLMDYTIEENIERIPLDVVAKAQ